ncbi:MAG: hypothetical protein COB22_08655 [Cycloclasticus sp.]|nr:MAG: hypothetical protein COB22_08655 [Cycloclasticus sp.]
MKIYATGVSLHKGEYEGNNYNFCKLYAVVPMQQSDTKKGSAGIDVRCEPQVYDVLKNSNFSTPVEIDCVTEMRALGGGNAKETIVKVTILK